MIAKLSCAVGAGLCVAAFPGTLAWLVPAGALAATVVYENTTPPDERRTHMRRLLAAPRAALGVDSAEWDAFKALPARDKLRYPFIGASAQELLGRAPLALPAPADVFGDDNGDGVAEGRTQRLTMPAVAQAAPRRRGPRVLSPDEFAADPLFQELNAEPHRMVIGHTQGGKSTAMHAMVQAWGAQGLPVYVGDPDAARGQWPGATRVSGYNEDYTGIAQMLATVDAIFVERSEEYSAGQRDFAPVHVVLDEVHETFANVPQSRVLVDKWTRRGAKRGVLVTLGTQDNHRDSLGLDSAAVLNNFITAELEKAQGGRRQARVYRGNAAQQKSMRVLAVPPLPSPKEYMRAEPEPPAPSTGTTQLVRRETAPAQAARGATLDLAALYKEAPSLAIKRGYVPTDLLAGLMDALPDEVAPAQSVTVSGTGDGGRGDVHVHVQQVAGRPQSARRRTTLDAQSRRARAEKYRVVLEAVRAEPAIGFNELRRRLGGDRNRLSEDWNRARRELGIEK